MFLELCSTASQKQHGGCFRSNAYTDVCFASVANV